MKIENKSKIARVRNDGRWHNRGSDWATPKDLFDKLNIEFHFTLDVCASDWNKKCAKYFSETDDGLKEDWGNNVCWMNPPYGKVLNDWMKKAFESALCGAIVVCLVPSATDTSWWHKYAINGEIRYLRGRPKFETKEGTWQQTFSPSVIVIFSKDTMCDCQYEEAKHYFNCIHNKNCKISNNMQHITYLCDNCGSQLPNRHLSINFASHSGWIKDIGSSNDIYWKHETEEKGIKQFCNSECLGDYFNRCEDYKEV